MTYRMTDEAMREAIARAVGWTLVEECWGENPSCGMYEPVPDYPADLNVIREAVLALPNGQRWTLEETLCDLRAMENKATGCDPSPLICATAAQVAEAFCRTVPCSCGCGLTIWECHKQ